MTQGERVKEVRKILGLTLESFGEKIGLKKNSMSQIENGRNELTEANAKAICREFNVNYNWLTTGEGEMLVTLSRDDQIASFVGDMLKEEDDSFKKRFISMLSALDASDWETLEKMAELLQEKGTDSQPQECLDVQVDQA